MASSAATRASGTDHTAGIRRKPSSPSRGPPNGQENPRRLGPQTIMAYVWLMSENSNHPIFMGHIFWAISPYPKGSKQPAPAGGQTCRPRRISLNPRQNVGETSSAKNNDLQSTIHYNSIIDTKCFWCFTRSSGAETKPNKSCTQLEVGDALKCITSNNEIKHILREPVGTEKGDQLQKLDTFTLYIYIMAIHYSYLLVKSLLMMI